MQWAEVVADPSLRDLPFKIELNQWGLIEMSPASTWHFGLQGRVVRYINRKLLDGESGGEVPIMTALGVRVPDAAWRSEAHIRKHAYESHFRSHPNSASKFAQNPTPTQSSKRRPPPIWQRARTRFGGLNWTRGCACLTPPVRWRAPRW